MLRAFREEDLGFMDRLDTDPAALGSFEWFGFRDVRARRRRWEHDGFVGPDSMALAVVAADGTLIGIASWQANSCVWRTPYLACSFLGPAGLSVS